MSDGQWVLIEFGKYWLDSLPQLCTQREAIYKWDQRYYLSSRRTNKYFLVKPTELPSATQLVTNSGLTTYLSTSVCSILSLNPRRAHYGTSFQYHVAQILLHRPLITRTLSKAINVQKGVGLPDIHLKVCRQSASEIVKLLQIYQYHYSLVSQIYLSWLSLRDDTRLRMIVALDSCWNYLSHVYSRHNSLVRRNERG
jgi:hypothetical protein